jgi:hypothetical protein
MQVARRSIDTDYRFTPIFTGSSSDQEWLGILCQMGAGLQRNRSQGTFGVGSEQKTIYRKGEMVRHVQGNGEVLDRNRVLRSGSCDKPLNEAFCGQ